MWCLSNRVCRLENAIVGHFGGGGDYITEAQSWFNVNRLDSH